MPMNCFSKCVERTISAPVVVKPYCFGEHSGMALFMCEPDPLELVSNELMDELELMNLEYGPEWEERFYEWEKRVEAEIPLAYPASWID